MNEKEYLENVEALLMRLNTFIATDDYATKEPLMKTIQETVNRKNRYKEVEKVTMK